MSKREKEILERQLKSLIKRNSISNRRNCSKYWSGVTKSHYMVMCELLYKFVKSGYEVFTEVEGVNGKWRADLVAINGSGSQIVEILHTETDEKFNRKKLTYPKEFILRKVRTKDFDISSFDI